MKYIKLFENYDDPLFIKMGHKEYDDFHNRRTELDIDPDMDEIKRMFKKVFGNVTPYVYDGYEYLEMELYVTHGVANYMSFRLPMKHEVGTPPSINIIKTDDDWFGVIYFPQNKNPNRFLSSPDNSCFQADTINGLEDLFIELRDNYL
jgi:hypothetical protein